MKKVLFILALLTLTGCGPRLSQSATAAPTMTAIPLPTPTPTQVVAEAKPASPTLHPVTASPSPTTTPTATTTVEPSTTPLPPPPQPTATATTTAAARPRAVKPRPTATSQFSGKLLFQTTIGGDFYLIKADGTDLRRLTDGVDPAWSPDGGQIAFTRWREPRGVWVVDVTTGREWRVFDWSQARWPSWSPDGREILFSRQHGGRLEEEEQCFWGFCFTIPARPHWRLGLVGVDGRGFREPPSDLISLAPDWSPDGRQVVYQGEHGLTVRALDGEGASCLTDDSRDTSPVWSPDGRRITFTRRQHDHWEIYAIDADGRRLTRLTDTPTRPDGQPGHSAAAAWSPDGRFLAFLTDRSGKWEIWVMRADGSHPQPMFGSALDGLTLDYHSVGERAISWTP